MELPAQFRLLIFVARRAATDLWYGIGDLTVNTLPFPYAVNDRVSVRSTMRCMYRLTIIGFSILVAVTPGTALDRRGCHIKGGALMFAMAHGARNTGLLVGLCVGRMKFGRRMTSDTRIFDRLVQRMAGRA